MTDILAELLERITNRMDQLWERLPDSSHADPKEWTVDECVATGAFRELEDLQDFYEGLKKREEEIKRV